MQHKKGSELEGLRELQQISDLLRLNPKVEEVFERVAQAVAQNLEFALVLFSLKDGARPFFRRVAQHGVPDDEWNRLKVQEVPEKYYSSVMQPEYRVSKSFLIPHTAHVSQDQYSYTADAPPPVEGDDWHPEDMLLVPMHDPDGKLIGILSVDQPADGKIPNLPKITLLEIFSNLAAQAILNNLQYRRTVNQLTEVQLLHDINEATLSELDSDQLFARLVEIIRLRLPVNLVTLYLRDEQTLDLIPVAGDGLMEDTPTPELVRQSLAENRIMERNTLSETANGPVEVAIPITIGSKVTALLHVQADTTAFATELPLLYDIRSSLSLALEKAFIFRGRADAFHRREVLLEVGSAISSVLELPVLLEKVLDILTTSFNVSHAAIYLSDADLVGIHAFTSPSAPRISQFVLRAAVGRPDLSPGATVPLDASTSAGQVAMSRQVKWLNLAGEEPFDPENGSEVVLPLVHQAQTIGVLELLSSHNYRMTYEDMDFFKIFATQLSVAIHNAMLYEATKQMAITDGLTGLFNHRYFMKQLNWEVRRSKQLKRPMSLLMLDIDFFKNYNDNAGHLAGDMVLRDLAKILTQSVRAEEDIVARYGGEEFAAILFDTPVSQAQLVAERIRKAVAAYPFASREIQPQKAITVSLGVAEVPRHTRQYDDLANKADQALYQAKRNGRNRVVVYSPAFQFLA